jgi:hypothetical protein
LALVLDLDPEYPWVVEYELDLELKLAVVSE